MGCGENVTSNSVSISPEVPSKLLVLACAVMEKELLPFQNGRLDFRFLDYGLHLTPGNLTRVLQEEIDRITERAYGGIVLGYGLCSNGVVGLRATHHPLVIPRVHDCISLFLGSSDRYQEEATKHPGTYYLTPGWIEKGETPISKYNAYARSYNEEIAGWVLHEEMKHYTRILLIDTGISPMSPYREIARQNAEFLKISFQELQGAPSLFQRLVTGSWGKEFLIVDKGQSIEQEMFLGP